LQTVGDGTMTSPARSEVKEDLLPLQRVRRALDDAKRSLKEFRRTRSVKRDRALSHSVDLLRRKVKKGKKLAQGIAERWFENSTY
jgi:hypothetical protein